MLLSLPPKCWDCGCVAPGSVCVVPGIKAQVHIGKHATSWLHLWPMMLYGLDDWARTLPILIPHFIVWKLKHFLLHTHASSSILLFLCATRHFIVKKLWFPLQEIQRCFNGWERIAYLAPFTDFARSSPTFYSILFILFYFHFCSEVQLLDKLDFPRVWKAPLLLPCSLTFRRASHSSHNPAQWRPSEWRQENELHRQLWAHYGTHKVVQPTIKNSRYFWAWWHIPVIPAFEETLGYTEGLCLKI